MKSLALTVIILLGSFGSACAEDFAGDIQNWIRAGLTVLVCHEAGHSSRGANERDFKFTGGTIGLDYKLSFSLPPAPQTYHEALDGSETDGNKTDYLPAAIYSRYQSDIKSWRSNVLRSEAAVAGGGFDGQQTAVEQLKGEDKRRALVVSAMLKAGYVAYHFADKDNYGDVVRTAWSVPVVLPITALLISSASDLFRATREDIPRWSIGYFSSSGNGAVGLQFYTTF
ncbi:hypothetical protein [Trichlorobacter lovleyi]|uniref:hypothetical protein n=1 Tax=Trichlorobacter lovleyi TaxID=313985 RepID=UPI0024808DDC|nr:hypothetical protein [Trichlorobacter lovleyi]